ncbi:MAG: enoyl-CoA hydratase/isomerase family protein [Acidimicrobiales bacterium]
MVDETKVVRVERRDDGVAVVRLDHPKVNAISAQVRSQLLAAAESLIADPPGAVVVTGGDRIFAAGADITEFEQAEPSRVGAHFLETLNTWAAVPRVTIAAIAGYALGGGCEVALACDFRMASDRAKLGQPEILLGLIPGGGATQRLARLVGPARTKDLVLSGRQVDADEALAIGLVDWVVPHDELHERAIEKAAEFARGALAAQALGKRAVDRGLDGSMAAGLELEQQLFAEVFTTDDARIGVRSFLEHGPGQAEFTGR